MNVNYAVRVEGRACKKGVEAYAEAWSLGESLEEDF